MTRKYTIQLASKISGVGVHAIRAWEKRYAAVVPKRNDKGRREYSEKDVERLMLLSELCTMGHTIGQIASIETTELKSMLKQLGVAGEKENFSKNLINTRASLEGLLLALEHYKLDVLAHEIGKLKLVLNPRQIVFDILSPLFREVGILVEQKKLSVSQEHALSAIMKFHMGHSIFKNYNFRSKREMGVILAGPEGELHEFGLMQAALLCCHYNLNFYYLGPNLPASALLDTYKTVKADIIVLGATMVEDMNDLRKYIGFLLPQLKKEDHMVLGGNVLFTDKDFKNHNVVVARDMLSLDRFLKKL